MFLTICGFNLSAYAYTDNIEKYEITVSINEDAKAEMTYHIRWKVLESDSLGPVDWIQVGVANGYCENVEPLNDTAKYAYYDGNNRVRVDLDRKYYEGEVFEVEFSLTQDYIYTTTEGSDTATYSFTPGWFDDIPVDEFVLRWNAENALTWSPDCYIDADNYLVFEKSLSAGERYNVTVTYPRDAYNFENHVNVITQYSSSNNNTYSTYNNSYYDDDGDVAQLGFVVLIIFIFVIFRGLIKIAASSSYSSGSGFEPSKVITRKMITYYPTCPGCGAVRNEEMTTCEYCGRSFIEKEEIVTEKAILDDKRYANDGSYKYNNDPNIYIHVTSRPAPRPTHTTTHHSSSCVHSSCACACASCACACACACAGGGRAGCSTKDFYNTGLKLKRLEVKAKTKAQTK